MTPDIPIETLREAARRPEVVEAMEFFYEEADRRIAAHQPTCWNRGACCRFGEYGHRLYVTSLEVVYYLAQRGRSASEGSLFHTIPEPEGLAAAAMSLPVIPSSANPSLPPSQRFGVTSALAALTADTCPHAHDHRCHARDRRPLGCRTFYCNPNAQDWQGPLTEECLQELKRLHWELGVPYFYADWIRVLRSLQDHSAL